MGTQARITALRSTLAVEGVDGFLLPIADEFLGEYVPPSGQRLGWLTGFTGSAGLVAVTADKAAFFTDGRYTLQARAEVDAKLFALHNMGETRPEAWLLDHLGKGAKLAIDARLSSMHSVKRLEKALAKKSVTLVPLSPNPVDRLWKDRPAAPAGEARVQEQRYAGVSHGEKRAQAAKALAEKNLDAALLVASDSVNWLLNIRGRDLEFTPVVLAYALLEVSGKVKLYLDASRVSAEVKAHLGNEVALRAPALLEEDLRALAGKRVLLDPDLTPYHFARLLKEAGAEAVEGDDPCQLPKAIKNAVELQGIRAAHVRDGLAVSRLLAWLDAQSELPSEMQVMETLREFRARAPEFISPSFETIAGSGPNGAIVHYRSTQATDRQLRRGELFLLDSGGQYPDGTTDITRTLAVGEPSAEMKRHFTLVLKGHIALARARFPEGTAGGQLDALARVSLWQEGLDYDHGTGHGVGHCLGVHEGPQRISKRAGDTVALKPGMVVSNEPGYYREGKYGIRIENLVAVVEKGAMENGKKSLGFETLTCVPIDRRLVEASLLDAREVEWWNAYHAWVWENLLPLAEGEVKGWIEGACAPL